jgi:hypothetical protein
MKIKTGIVAGMGLGDTFAEITRLTGLDQFANAYEKLTGNSCGCEERQQKLNQLLPFSST